MAIKKTVCFVVVILLLFVFSVPVFASSMPPFSDDELLQFQENACAYVVSDSIPGGYDAYTIMGEVTSFEYHPDRQYYIFTQIEGLGEFYVPVSSWHYVMEESGEYYDLYFFGLDENFKPVYPFGCMVVPSLGGCNFVASPLVEGYPCISLLTYLDVPSDPNPVTVALSVVTQWISMLFVSFFSRSGSLQPLIILLLLGISVSVLIYLIKVFRVFLWGY